MTARSLKVSPQRSHCCTAFFRIPIVLPIQAANRVRQLCCQADILANRVGKGDATVIIHNCATL